MLSSHFRFPVGPSVRHSGMELNRGKRALVLLTDLGTLRILVEMYTILKKFQSRRVSGLAFVSFVSVDDGA